MKGKTGLGPDVELVFPGLGPEIKLGFSGLGDGFSGLDLGFVVGVLVWGSLLFAWLVVELGEGLDFGAGEGLWSPPVAVATAGADEDDSQRDLRWSEWEEKEE